MINLSYSIQDIQLAIVSRFDIELTEDEIVEFLRSRQTDMEDRMSELCWDVIEDTFEEHDLKKYITAE